jgi:hypothetical protein
MKGVMEGFDKVKKKALVFGEHAGSKSVFGKGEG